MINEDFGYEHKKRKVLNWLKNLKRGVKYIQGFNNDGSGKREFGFTQIDKYGNELQFMSIDDVKEKLQVMCKNWFVDREERDEFINKTVDAYLHPESISRYGTIMKLKEGELDRIVKKVLNEELKKK